MRMSIKNQMNSLPDSMLFVLQIHPLSLWYACCTAVHALSVLRTSVYVQFCYAITEYSLSVKKWCG